ncbi:Superfamily II DNA and RNA helicase [Demequina mangrovi]|uniref:Superfamily II DNA and RNA helicase n=3 Tax=Demequina mangrovi TaxID=1043493 RepID=A0A1H6WUS1_9MICO|nr:DEAD/DEAH box helicase [Demequina mangrovi]SEJ18017.1 Superfamily II DNA and RNA helicase [Demequina mangrovi]
MSSTTFAELGVPTPLTDVLEAEGKRHAFPIQVDTLPDTLAGRDVLGRGRTGSGKTLAFSIPIASRLGSRSGRAKPGRPRALILAPTRELATQIDAVIAPLAAAYGMRTATIFGGVSQRRQEQALQRGVDIVVACPGRLEDLMGQGHVSLDGVEITVLDEADHMADLGFLPGVTRIMSKTPQRGQRLLFSATLDNGVDKLVKRFLTDPVMHSVDDASSPVEAMTHHVFHVAGADAKKDLVHALASGTSRRILFTRTKHQAKKLAKQLTAAGIPAVDLHGNLSQNARDRNLAAFAGDGVRVLVATDVAARGVHVDGVELVVHVDPPAEHKAYLHRSGRTARAGSAGDVVTVVMPEQRKETDLLLKKAKITVRPEAVSAASAPVVRLIGEVAAHVAPSTAAAPQAHHTSRPGGSRPAGGRGRRSGGRGAGRGTVAGAQGGSATGGSQKSGGRSQGRSGASQGGSQAGSQGGSQPRGGSAGRASGSTSGGAAAFSARGGSGGRRRSR